jgi:hypothetical protein
MLSGVGDLCLRTLDYDTDNFIFPGKFVEFSLSSDTTSKEALAWVNGNLQTVASGIDKTSYTLTISSDYVDWPTLGWAFDEVPSISANKLVPVTKAAVADGSGVITDANVTASDEVFCFVGSRGTWGEPHAIAAADVTVGAGTITLSATYINAPISYSYDRSYASIETIGVESNVTKYGKLSFSGLLYGPSFPDGVVIVIPDISRKSDPELATGDVPRFTVEYSANVPTGFNKPFKMFNLATVS